LLEGRELIGVLLMATQQVNFFQPHQSPFFGAIAHQAALALSNAQLHTQVQQMAILEERYRLSREMHDGLAQTLGSLGWHLDYLLADSASLSP
jgi:nitrate/nitrite-specific signal transduction histidine kinase